MNAETPACELPVGALSWSGVDQTRKPDERDGERSTVGKVDSEQVFVDSNIDDALTGSCFRSSHARPSGVRLAQSPPNVPLLSSGRIQKPRPH
jgi:hypothetical protein